MVTLLFATEKARRAGESASEPVRAIEIESMTFSRFAPVKVASLVSAPVRFAKERFAPLKLAPARLVSVRLRPERFAPLRSTAGPTRNPPMIWKPSGKLVGVPVMPLEMTPLRFRSARSALVRSAPVRLVAGPTKNPLKIRAPLSTKKSFQKPKTPPKLSAFASSTQAVGPEPMFSKVLLSV